MAEYEEYKCTAEACKYYLDRPICQNHAHVYCERYETEKDLTDWLDKRREEKEKHDYE